MKPYYITPNMMPRTSIRLVHLVNSQTLPNLRYGVMEKPRDKDGDVNMWQAFVGTSHYGTDNVFIGHFDSKAKAAAAIYAKRKGQ